MHPLLQQLCQPSFLRTTRLSSGVGAMRRVVVGLVLVKLLNWLGHIHHLQKYNSKAYGFRK